MEITELRRFRQLEQEIKQLNDDIGAINARYLYPVSPNMQSSRSGSSDGRRAEIYAVKVELLAERLKSVTDDYKALGAEIENALRQLEPLERAILTEHYIVGFSWRKIAMRWNYSEAQIYRLRNKAIMALQRK